jgi:hypothetical protein
MSKPNSDPDEWVKKLSEKYSSIRLARGGVVSKTGHAMLAVIATWAVIFWQLSDNAIRNISLILGGAILTGVFIWWVRSTQRFAERNPAQAMLEGAEFLEWHKFEAQAKGLPKLQSSPIISDPSQPLPAIDAPIRPDSDG